MFPQILLFLVHQALPAKNDKWLWKREWLRRVKPLVFCPYRVSFKQNPQFWAIYYKARQKASHPSWYMRVPPEVECDLITLLLFLRDYFNLINFGFLRLASTYTRKLINLNPFFFFFLPSWFWAEVSQSKILRRKKREILKPHWKVSTLKFNRDGLWLQSSDIVARACFPFGQHKERGKQCLSFLIISQSYF